MKKLLKISLFLIISLVFLVTDVSASTNTKVRTHEDYLVGSWVTVTDSNVNNILNTPAVDASEKIYDFANLLTDSEEIALYSEISNYIDTYDMDLAIVTIDDNNKGSQQVYADDFYDYNYFGINSTRDGLLFLIDMEYRQIYISTTGSAINMYNDYRIEKTLDAVYMYMTDKDYYEGTSEFIDVISKYAEKGLPSKLDNEDLVTDSIFIAIVFSLIITSITMFILIRKNKLVRKATTAREYLNKESVVVNNMGDIFMGSSTVKHRIQSDSSGGSSTHIGSSGSSHGGGGRGF